MRVILAALVLVLASASVSRAHEGHNIRVMGTVAAIHEQHLTITTTAGKTSVVILDDKTKVLRGKAVKTAADIKVGERVVVTASDVKGKDGKTTLKAKQVSLGAAPVAAVKK